ncbi:MAG: hypothetical protein ABW047_01360, partial [Nitrospiraceae bacterium]
FLTTHLSQLSGIEVVPFDETRRLLADIVPDGSALNAEQADTLAARTGADMVIAGLIHDYGRVRWQYWTTGWLMHVAAATTLLQSVSTLPSMRPRIFRCGTAGPRYLGGLSVRSVYMRTLCKPEIVRE